ncbi:MAG: penicillin-binding protein 1A [Rhodobacteraceae bacterium]|nr:penicillin-binding protein 1A [Paracoccaceae bacterium]
MLRAILNFFGFLFSWAVLGTIMGGMGLTTLFWIYSQDLPNYEQLALYEPPTLSRIYSARGLVMDEFARERRIFTPVDEMPEVVKAAFISAEDKNFYNHAGYDPLGILKALITAAQGGRLRGASTITQQVMKNFLLDGSRKLERKIKEIVLAARIENTLSKEDILSLYLNEIFLGQNSYGVTAAAQTYFGKTLEQLSIAEAAFLAVQPKAPSDYHPVRNREKAVERRNFILKEMAENGYITPEEADEAKAEPLRTVQGGELPSSREQLPPRSYFTDEIRRQLSRTMGNDELFAGGLSIRSTMDPDLQRVAAKALQRRLVEYDRALKVYWGPLAIIENAEAMTEQGWRDALNDISLPRDIEGWSLAVVLKVGKTSVRVGIEGVEEVDDGYYLKVSDSTWARTVDEDNKPRGTPKAAEDIWALGDVVLVSANMKGDEFQFWEMQQVPAIQGAFMAMDTQTGRVLAMQGGFSYQTSVFNRATQANRQPGSAFKPFVYASALDNGYTPATIVVDAPIEVETPEGIWRPQNSSKKFYGPAPLRTGIEYSRNLMTIRVAQSVGMDVVSNYAERFGVYDDMPELISFALGAGETTLFKMVAAYAMFANGGKQVEPTLVDRVQDRYGNTVFRHDQRVCEDCQGFEMAMDREPWVKDNSVRIMDQITAYQLTSMMQGVVRNGTASRTVGSVLNVPMAGKTGTTNQTKDAWFIGFTPKIVAGCYIGFDTPKPMGRGAYGGSLCGPVFAEFMKVALETYPTTTYDVPPGSVFVKIDRYTGVRLNDDEEGDYVVSELFRKGEEPGYGSYGEFIDGGFVMGRDLLFFNRGEGETFETVIIGGEEVIIPIKPTFGGLSSGGLY